MIKCAKEMRAAAADALRGKWKDAVLTTLVCMAIVMVASFLLSFCGPLSLVASIGSVILVAGLQVALLQMVRTKDSLYIRFFQRVAPLGNNAFGICLHFFVDTIVYYSWNNQRLILCIDTIYFKR